jgi:hypothetical protein
MTVKEMIIESLGIHQYDGLFNEYGECACEISDLIPCCGDGVKSCKAGYKTPCDCGDDHNFHIVKEKPQKREANK